MGALCYWIIDLSCNGYWIIDPLGSGDGFHSLVAPGFRFLAFDVKRTCFVGVLQLVLHLVCCYILASRTFNLNNKCCWFQKKTGQHVLFVSAA